MVTDYSDVKKKLLKKVKFGWIKNDNHIKKQTPALLKHLSISADSLPLFPLPVK